MGADKEVGVYYGCWSQWEWPPKYIPAKDLSLIFLAFLDVDTDGTVKPNVNYEYIVDVAKTLKNTVQPKNPNLKLLVSIGGDAFSANFSSVAADSSKREKFAQTATDLINTWQFDGFDIDWEFPGSDTDGENFVSLLKACRKAMGNDKILTIASPAGPQHYNNLDFPGMNQYLDFYNLMAYNFSGSWYDKTSHASNLHQHDCTQLSVDQVLDAYQSNSVPTSKILLGMPLYGVTFEGTEGICQSYQSVSPNKPLFYQLLDGPKPTIDQDAGASYTYNSSNLTSWDSPDEIRLKAKYANDRNLAGGFFWDCGGDVKGDQSAVTTFKQGLLK